MKIVNGSALFVTVAIFLFGLSCNPFFTYVKQYDCRIEGEGEPGNSQAYVDRARRHLEINERNEDKGGCGLGACSEAVRLDPNNPDAYSCRAFFYAFYGTGEGSLDRALSDINEAIRLEPNEAQFYRQRNTIHDYKEMPEAAFADLNSVIAIGEKKNAAKHFDYAKRAETLLKKRRYKEAITDLDKAINLHAEDPFYYLNRARAYFELGKYEEAVKDCSEMIRLDPETVFGHLCRSDSHKKLGNEELSAIDQKRAEELQELTKQKKRPKGGSAQSGRSPLDMGGGFGRQQ